MRQRKQLRFCYRWPFENKYQHVGDIRVQEQHKDLEAARNSPQFRDFLRRNVQQATDKGRIDDDIFFGKGNLHGQIHNPREIGRLG
ncbi:hypothetical protein [Mesorhizobium sp. A623]